MLLRNALSNLVANALQHTAAGGAVALSALPLDGGIEPAVADTGSGIAPQQLPHIFERYYRADVSRRKPVISRQGLLKFGRKQYPMAPWENQHHKTGRQPQRRYAISHAAPPASLLPADGSRHPARTVWRLQMDPREGGPMKIFGQGPARRLWTLLSRRPR